MPDPSLGVLLFLPYRHLEQRVLDAVVGAGYPITLAQARVFQRVDPGGSRLTDLAAAAQVTKQTAGFLVDQLVEGGYVERVRDTTDARARLVRITRRGHDAIDVARAVQDEIEGEWRDHLGAEAFERLRADLLRLREITDPWA
ncbi:MAG: MarR family transcriptional regulator [Nocardioides sp.]|nr:MarR family transcriptional regulator [Nocardioidaceae bacterium]MCB8955675.1 MarR family transcriptional regulator [Nocardioides sp.]